MSDLRIVSLLPGATEILYAIGLGEKVVGVSHECDFPLEAKSKPQVVKPVFSSEGLSPSQIDAAVQSLTSQGKSLYAVDLALLRELKPTLIITQDLCLVCAPSRQDLQTALEQLAPKPQVLNIHPQRLDDIKTAIKQIAQVAGVCETLTAQLDQKISRIKLREPRRRVFCLEWTEPYYCSGHWIPEMVDLAGGTDVLGCPGERSHPVTMEEILKARPEVLVVMPCGFGLPEAIKQTQELISKKEWQAVPAVLSGEVYAVDGNAYFVRPGPRLWDGITLLAHLFHPRENAWTGAPNAFARVLTGRGAVKHCSICQTPFTCSSDEACWCAKLPKMPTINNPNLDCACPSCLQTMLSKKN